MKKLLSLLGALGMLVTTSSSVIACNQATKSIPEDNRTLLRVAITNNSLGLIQTETPPKKIELIKMAQPVDLAPYILERLVELNGGKEAIEFNLLDLVVAQPILINNFGDMKTTITVLDRSETHTGSVDVYFSIVIDNEALILQPDLGIFNESQDDLFVVESNGVIKMKSQAVKNQIIAVNPHLAEDRFAEQITINTASYL